MELLLMLTPAGSHPALPRALVAPSLAAEAKSLRILLAEDNVVNQKVALRLLDRLGYKPETVHNGAEAVRATVEGGYQLVFMDVQMPEVGGLEATRRIRALLPSERQPVIVALTANAITGDSEACKVAGMDDYVSKPVILEDIYNVIVRQFGRKSGLEEIRPSR